MPTVPKYERVVIAIRDQIKSGLLKPGDQLPKTEDLLKIHQVGYGTLRTALVILEGGGWIEGRQGEGRFVTLNPPIGGG
jgi:DNA-binding GntR family transcriptional regulator